MCADVDARWLIIDVVARKLLFVLFALLKILTFIGTRVVKDVSLLATG